MEPILADKLGFGLVDGIDEHDLPLGAFVKSEGFEYRRGYPRTVYGRERETSDEIRALFRVRDIQKWTNAAASTKFYVMTGNRLYESTQPTAFTTLRNKLFLDYDPSDGSERAVTASRSGNTVTFSGTAPKAKLTLAAGDYFYYDADGISKAGPISVVTDDTHVTLSAYTGSATSGAFTLLHSIPDTVETRLLIAGNRVWVFTRIRRPYWYDGTIFREAGLPAPATKLTVVLANASGLSAGNYFWSYAYEDADGRVGAVVTTGDYVAAAADKATLSGFVNGPSWATKVRVFRPIAGGDIAYNIHPDVTRKLASVAKDNGTSTLTLAADSVDLVAGMHVDRYVKFLASDTSYLITANDGATPSTITVSGDASGESGTDTIEITGGLDIDQVVAGSVIDLTPDASLDLDYEAPTHNTQPPVGLIYPHLFLGGGRICAYKYATQTEVYFSGRSTEASTPTGEATAGLGEFDYWHTSHYAGRQEGDIIKGFVNIGPRTFAVKEQSVWELFFGETDDVAEYFWFPRTNLVGCLAPYSIVSKEGIAYWLGHDADELDVIRFDGNVGFGMFRAIDHRLGGPRLRATLDSIVLTDVHKVTAAMFGGRLYISFPTVSTNNKTLRFDFRTFTADIQPWGCGVFAKPYYDSTEGLVLLCGDPAVLGHIYRVLGTQADNGSNIARELITGRLSYRGVPTKARWVEVFLRIINGEAITTAPVLSYSIDKYAFNSGSKTWETTMAGDTWPTTIGEHVIRKRIEVGEYSEDLMLKVTSTDAEDWGLKQIEVRGIPADQHHSLA